MKIKKLFKYCLYILLGLILSSAIARILLFTGFNWTKNFSISLESVNRDIDIGNSAGDHYIPYDRWIDLNFAIENNYEDRTVLGVDGYITIYDVFGNKAISDKRLTFFCDPLSTYHKGNKVIETVRFYAYDVDDDSYGDIWFNEVDDFSIEYNVRHIYYFHTNNNREPACVDTVNFTIDVTE